MSIPEQFKGFQSYSRYRGYNDKYNLSDEYFSKIVDGNLICTDTEKDIDCDGNIVLVTPEGDAIHLGTIPMTEDGSPVQITFDKNNNIHLHYKCYAANDHRHPYMEEKIISTQFSDKLKKKLILNKLISYLQTHLPRQTSKKVQKYFSFSPRSNELCIRTRGTLKTFSSWSHRASETEVDQFIRYTPEQGFYLDDISCSSQTTESIAELFRNDYLTPILKEFNQKLPEWFLKMELYSTSTQTLPMMQL